MKPIPARAYDDAAACADAFGSLFIHYVRTLALNDRLLAADALEAVRMQVLLALPAKGLSNADARSVLALIDAAATAVAPDGKPQ